MSNKFNLLHEIRKLLTAKQSAEMLAFVTQVESDVKKKQASLEKIIKQFDKQVWRDQIGALLEKQLPLEQLVPDCYAAWRPVVSEAVIFIGSRLSSKRLIAKLIEQIRLPDDTTLAQRLICFIAQMPSLQKLGQVVARNRNLDPELRQSLMNLENGIHDISPEEIQTLIEDRLGPLLNQYQVNIESQLHAEASVSALMRFSWQNPATAKKEQGVFKVIKPYINEYFNEEMNLLHDLAEHLDSKQDEHKLDQIKLRTIFDDIRNLLQQELDSLQEQTNLSEAHSRYQAVKGIRVPALIEPLSAPGITAMSFEQGVKVTDIFASKKSERNILASRIVEALIAMPLFDAEEDAVFHADPHAGNLFVDEGTHELILFDWALTERLNFEQRRKIILLVSALTLRDGNLIKRVIMDISDTNFGKETKCKQKLEEQIDEFLASLSLYRLPGMKDLLSLMDALILSGIEFSRPLLIFRKVLLTLDGVLHDVADDIAIEADIAQLVLEHLRDEMFGINFMQKSKPRFQLPLTSTDTYALVWSAQWYYFRNSLRASEQLWKSIS